MWGVVLVHSFCNWMGLPRVWGRVGGEGGKRVVRGKKGDDDGKEKDWEGEKGMGIGWTVGYYIVLVAGAFAWWKCLWWLTESEGALMRFGPSREKEI